jgi:hypothetical protein
MQRPTLERLVEPWGEFSPMGVLWSFMGFSTVYQIFTGIGEVLGSFLLVLRRTTTLGALLLCAVLSNVVLLNYTFDVTVKLYSWATRSTATSRSGSRTIVNRSVPMLQRVRLRHPGRGVTDEERRRPAALLSDSMRVKRVVFGGLSRATFRLMSDSVERYTAKVDSARHALTLAGRFDPSLTRSLFYTKPDPNHLMLAGKLGADSLMMRLRRVDENRFLLMNRGYHWIQELPFNR